MAQYDRQTTDQIKLSDKRVPSTLTPLQRKQFSRFLYFEIKDGTGQMPVTLLSLFSRMGTEPWNEAQALSKMPEYAATSCLARIILSTNASYTYANAQLVAEHLLTLLPIKVVTKQSISHHAMVLQQCVIVLTSASMFGWLMLVRRHYRPPALEQSSRPTFSEHRSDKPRAAEAPPVVQPTR